MESNGAKDTEALGRFFDSYQKSRMFSFGYSEFIVNIAKGDALKRKEQNDTPRTLDDDSEALEQM